jgi:plasmid stabilization system protein ParE
MSRRLIIRAEAEADIGEAAVWYEERDAGLGLDLTAEIRTAIRHVVARPLSQICLQKSPEVHRILARRFPYRIFYIVRADAIVVFAVIHAARHDCEWRKRV